MAKSGITNISGGGAIGSDELSVTADKVIEGNTYVGADTNDEIGAGTLVDRPSTVSAQSVAQGLSGGSNCIFTRIPTGAYRTPTSTGYPEITVLSSMVATAGGLSSDKMLAGKTAFGINGTATSDANVTPSQMLSGFFGYANGNRIAGNIASLGAHTINPTASQQIVSTSGKYLTGNVTVNGVSNLTAANIKKGVNVGGTIGTWEGWVPTVRDLYLRGNNTAGFVSSDERNFKFETAQITVSGYHIGSIGGSSTLRLNNYNLTKSSSINMEFSVTTADTRNPRDITLYVLKPGSPNYGYPLGAVSWSFANMATNQVLSINTTQIQEVVDIVVYIYHIDASVYRGYITRIWTT